MDQNKPGSRNYIKHTLVISASTLQIWLTWKELLGFTLQRYPEDKMQSVSIIISLHLFVGRWASFGGAAGSVRLHSVRSREADLSHGCQPARHDTGQGEIHRQGCREPLIPEILLVCSLSWVVLLFFISSGSDNWGSLSWGGGRGVVSWWSHPLCHLKHLRSAPPPPR